MQSTLFPVLLNLYSKCQKDWENLKSQISEYITKLRANQRLKQYLYKNVKDSIEEKEGNPQENKSEPANHHH